MFIISVILLVDVMENLNKDAWMPVNKEDLKREVLIYLAN